MAWKKKTMIKIPDEIDKDADIEMQLLSFKSILEDVPEEDNERTLFLQYETKNKSCNSDDASTGYGSGSSMTSITGDWSNNYEEISTKSQDAEESTPIKAKTTVSIETLGSEDFEKFTKMSETHTANLVKEKTVTGTENKMNAFKINVTALMSPDKNYNQENKSDDEVNSSIISVPEEETSSFNIVSVSEGTNHDMERLNWNRIFWFLIRQIDPSTYSLFFTFLFENAGATNASNLIKSTELDTNSMHETMFTLFNIWKHGAGTAAKPSDIENVFESMEMNKQLHEFQKFMRNPPYLPDDRSWNELRIPCNVPERGLPLPQQPLFLQIQVNSRDEGHPQTRAISFNSENVEETVVESNNSVSLSTRFHNVRRRKYDGYSEVNTKYMRLDDSSMQNTVKPKIKHHRRKRRNDKLQSKPNTSDGKKSINRQSIGSSTKVSSSSSSTTTISQSSAELFSSPPLSGYSYGHSSGYSSMSSNTDDYKLISSNNTVYGSLSENYPVRESCKDLENQQSLDCSVNRHHQQYPLAYISPELKQDNQGKENILNTACTSTSLHWDVTSNENSKHRRRKQTINNKKSSKRIRKKPRSKKRRNPKMTKQELWEIISAFAENVINDLLARMSPSREDFLSLTYKAYSEAECLITSWKEKIFIISSGKQSLALRQCEWNTIREYVTKVRNRRMPKSCHKNDSLFLNTSENLFT